MFTNAYVTKFLEGHYHCTVKPRPVKLRKNNYISMEEYRYFSVYLSFPVQEPKNYGQFTHFKIICNITAVEHHSLN